MAQVFISYRRTDSGGYVGWLHELLLRAIDSSKIFCDIHSIDYGTDFSAEIEKAVSKCDVLLAVIGPHWLTASDENGVLRLHKVDDLVRLEIASAFRLGKVVIPVLVGKTPMPHREALPEEIRGLPDIQAVELSDEHFAVGVERLAKDIRRIRNLVRKRLQSIKVGNLEIAAAIEAVDVSAPFTSQRLTTYYDSSWRNGIPQFWRPFMSGIIHEAEKEAEARHQVLFDGPAYFVKDYELLVSHTEPETQNLRLLLGPSSYYEGLATNEVLRRRETLETGEIISLVEKYPLASLELRDFPLSNNLGVNLNILTSDGFFLLQMRSNRVRNFRMQAASAVNAIMSRGTPSHPQDEDKNGNPDPFATAIREANEELGLAMERTDVKFFGLAVELEKFQPNLFGEIMIADSAEKTIDRGKLLARDRFEYHNLLALPFELPHIADSLFNADSHWVPICALALTYSAIHNFGYDQVESAFSHHRPTFRIGDSLT